MAIQLLSEAKIRTLKAGPKEQFVADGGGLYLRVSTTGAKHWFFRYQGKDGKRRKVMLGAYPTHSLMGARTWAQEQTRALDLNIDPAQKKREDRQEIKVKAEHTCEKLLEAYVEHLGSKNKQTSYDASNIFKLHIPEEVKALPAAQVSHADLVAPIRKLKEAGKLRTASKLRSYVRAAFEMALTAEDDPNTPASLLGFRLIANPAAGIKVPEGANKAKTRALSLAELVEYAKHLEALPEGDTKDQLRLQLLLAGQRFSQLQRAYLEGDNIVQLDPKGKRTTPRVHVLPLQGEALALVDRRKRKLFNPERNRLDLEDGSAAVREISKAMGGQPFSLGDIRRSAETLLASMGYSSDWIGKLLSHGQGGVQNRHYNMHDYMAEKRQMLAAWEESLKGATKKKPRVTRDKTT